MTIAPIPFRGPHCPAKNAHMAAMMSPKPGFESAIVTLCSALYEYAVAHQERYESAIGNDYVLGAEWKQAASAVIGLLNGETGRLDCGSIDGFIRDLAKENGIDDEM